MKNSRENFVRSVMSGADRSMSASALRGLLSIAEPFYAGLMLIRNRLYDWHVFSARRVRIPVISVGNITAGGTGKTPTVRWLASRLRELGRRPAILLRGYRPFRVRNSEFRIQNSGFQGDEQAMLQEYLGGFDPPVLVHAEPDRVAAASLICRQQPEIDTLILDDGFQHRRLFRGFDLVLIDACNPFGFGHIHPRGLLREPLSGLRRADAFLLTRSDQAEPSQLDRITATIREHNSIAPMYRATHALVGLRSASLPASAEPDATLDRLSERPFFAFAGIAQPEALDRQLSTFGPTYRGHEWFPDHHDYTPDDLRRLRDQALSAGAQLIITTEKDWAKLRHLPSAAEPSPPILRLEMQLHLSDRDEQGILKLIQARLDGARGPD
jgi:tetraacyldisaccharide 4'-kinase